jgi:peptide/nickel transport system substrate-binding protein
MDWPGWPYLARRVPTLPSRRVVIALAIAAAIGLAVSVIWWATSLRRTSPAPPAESASVGENGNAALAPPEPLLPRGGSLRGWTDGFAPGWAHHLEEATSRLTQATLVRVNRSTDRVEPWLAESWTTSADNLTHTFKLRPALLWSDATFLTAEDVVASISSIQVMGKPLVARAIDPLTIEVRFPEAFGASLRVFDRHPIRARHEQPDRVGLGPFVPASDKAPAGRPAARIFVRNPHYWRRAADGSSLPYLDRLELTPGPLDQDFGDAAIRVDDYEQLKKLEQSGKARLFELGPGLDADALWLKVDAGGQDKPWLATERFRLAVSTAVDRREYCKQVFFGACDPIAGPVSPANVAWFNPDLPLGRGEPEVAREMLAELGLRDRSGDGMLDDAARRPVRLSLLVRGDVSSSRRAATFLKETLRAVGVDVIVTELEASRLRARRAKGNYEAIYDRIEFNDTDPAMNLDFWLSSGDAHVWNPGRVSPPADWERQIDQLMMKNTALFDRIERLQAFVEVQRIYNQHMPALFFGVPYVRIFTSTRVLNATPSPLRPHLLWNADRLAALK